MSDSPSFFVPAATPEEQEDVYAEMAKWCKSGVPNSGKRVYSITFVHDGTEWTATVGERLSGFRRKTKKSNGQHVEQTITVDDPAVVLAIFAGNPYMVVTNHRIGADVRSAWVNPFMAGKPLSVRYFRATK